MWPSLQIKELLTFTAHTNRELSSSKAIFHNPAVIKEMNKRHAFYGNTPTYV